MLTLQTERFGDVSVIHCQGRIVLEDAAYQLRDVVRAERSAKTILIDFSDVQALEGGGLGMLLYLQRWTRERDIAFCIFDPPERVRHSLARFRAAVEIADTGDVLSLLGWKTPTFTEHADHTQYRRAA